MKLRYSNYYTKNKYRFQIEQVSISSYSNYYDWDNLNEVTSTNVDDNGLDDYTFKWEEIKQEGKTYIFILTPEQFYNFDYKIKIENIQIAQYYCWNNCISDCYNNRNRFNFLLL